MKSFSQSEFILKKVVFLLIFVPLLLLMARSAHAQVPDPCSSALPVAHDNTGCGALITVYTVDHVSQKATSFAVIKTGSSYDTEQDDWLIGIINNSSTPLKSIDLSTPLNTTPGIFAFDGDGACDVNFKDCFAGFSSFFAPYYGYAGPDNKFTGISSGGQSGTVVFTNAIPAISCVTPAAQFCNSTWFSLEGLPVTNVTQKLNTQTSVNGSTIFTADFSDPDPSTLTQTITIPPSPANPNGSNMMATTNFPVPPTATANTFGWPEYVAGTPWAPSLCIQKLANGGACSLYVNACWNSATQSLATASDAYCPTAVLNSPNPSQIVLQDIFDWNKVAIPNGMTASLIAFTPPFFYTNGVPCTPANTTCNPYFQWTPSSFGANQNPVCTIFLTPGTQCYIADRLVDMYGDQTTTRGSSPKTKSWNITAYDVPMLLTQVVVMGCPSPTSPLNDIVTTDVASPIAFEDPTFAANKWNNGACLLDFKINPAQIPPTFAGSANSFLAAPPVAIRYGKGAPVTLNDPLLNSDTILTNLSCNNVSACDTAVNLTLSQYFGADGTYTIHWSAEDTAGISEKNIHLNSTANTTCLNPYYNPADPASGPQTFNEPCYQTNFFTTQVNIDSVAPKMTPTFSPAGSPAGTFYQGEPNVFPVYTCTDDRSGVATCGGIAVPRNADGSCPLTPASVTAPNALSTASLGPNSYNVNVTDCAGNTTGTAVNYNVVVPFTISVSPLSQTISSGQQGPLFTITVTPLGGLTGSVGLKCATTPAITGLTCSVTPNVDNLTGKPISSTVTLAASKNVTHQTYLVTFTATDSALSGPGSTASTTATLIVKGNNNN